MNQNTNHILQKEIDIPEEDIIYKASTDMEDVEITSEKKQLKQSDEFFSKVSKLDVTESTMLEESTVAEESD